MAFSIMKNWIRNNYGDEIGEMNKDEYAQFIILSTAVVTPEIAKNQFRKCRIPVEYTDNV